MHRQVAHPSQSDRFGTAGKQAARTRRYINQPSVSCLFPPKNDLVSLESKTKNVGIPSASASSFSRHICSSSSDSTMISSDAKTAEFARLFYFLKRVATRGAQSSDLDVPTDDLRSLPIPEELEPVIKRLSAIVGTTKAACKTLGSDPRRNIVVSTNRSSSTLDPDDDSDEDEESLAKFPLGRRYPFTFKLMVHKLYQVDEWAKMVKEMLEKSKMEFKPLAQRDAVVDEDKAEEEQDEVASANTNKNTIHFKIGVSSGGGRRGSVVGGRQRSQSVVVSGPKTVGPASPLLKSPGSGGQTEFRALKKRCIGRRRSMSGPINGGSVTGRIGGSWVYDAAISSAEHPASTTFPAFPSAPPPSPTAQTGFSSYQTLGPLGAPKKVATGGNMISGGIPMTLTPLALAFRPVTNINLADRISARKRALTVDGMRGVSEVQKKQMKRPFAD